MNRLKKYHSPRMGRVEHIHFVGIGGVGMSGIAEVLFNQGYTVSGSDCSESKTVKRLTQLGITVYIGHAEEHIKGADVLVKSTAVTDDNIELVAAKASRIPVIPRAAMLAELMRFKHGIAIAGTHGKTTTTSLVSSLLAEGGLDPSYVIGGKLNSSGSNAKLGASEYFVAEADESDASFLFLKPTMAVVTNIDADHMSAYNDDFDKLRKTFVEFLHHLPFYGLAVLCCDDPEVAAILAEVERPILTYGFSEHADFKIKNWHQQGMMSHFVVERPLDLSELEVCINLPGQHNALNAVAAIAIATELGIDDGAILHALAKFEGVGRRVQILGDISFDSGNALLIDDYGHHPREITSTLNALRKAWPDNRLIHVFQPHRYSRTHSLFDDFISALSLADELLLLDIYSAGESPIPGVSSEALASELIKNNVKVHLVSDGELRQCLDKVVSTGDVILTQGAGSIGQLAMNLATKQKENV